MPLIQLRVNLQKISEQDFKSLLKNLTVVVAKALSCEEGGKLEPADIMIEVNYSLPLDVNIKDIGVRVLAHDYQERRGKDLATLDAIQREISNEVVSHLAPGVSWYVWVILAPTSYGSDTQQYGIKFS